MLRRLCRCCCDDDAVDPAATSKELRARVGALLSHYPGAFFAAVVAPDGEVLCVHPASPQRHDFAERVDDCSTLLHSGHGELASLLVAVREVHRHAPAVGAAAGVRGPRITRVVGRRRHLTLVQLPDDVATVAIFAAVPGEPELAKDGRTDPLAFVTGSPSLALRPAVAIQREEALAASDLAATDDFFRVAALAAELQRQVRPPR